MPFELFDPGQPDPLPASVTDHWRKLALDGSQIDPLCCMPEWNLAYHQCFHPGQRIFYLADDDAFLIFSEHLASDGQVYMTPLEDSWMFANPLSGRKSGRLLVRAIELWEEEYGYTPAIILGGMPDVSQRRPNAKTLETVFLCESRFDILNIASCKQCYASLAGGLEGWASRRSANHRAKLRKAQRKARERGITYERFAPTTPAECEAIFSRMLAIEYQCWKGRAHCGMEEPSSRAFYSALLNRYARSGSARIILATCEGRDIGYVFGGYFGGVYRGQQFSYVTDFASFSPGNLLQLEKVAWLCEQGAAAYYMGPISGPRMGYKAHWTEKITESQTWVMRPKRISHQNRLPGLQHRL